MTSDKKLVYTVDLPTIKPVIFINGIRARNIKGFFWLWRNLFKMRKMVIKAPGCVQVKAGICSRLEIVMISFWDNAASLTNFFHSDYHKTLMHYLYHNPENLCLYNETYTPQQSGKYVHEPQGLALVVEKGKLGEKKSQS